MAGRMMRAAVVGVSTLLGKEVAEELALAKSPGWDVTLLDAPDAAGQVTAAGDEALLIQPVSASAFEHIDVVFFAGDMATTLKFWTYARAAGASIVDLSRALEGEPGVLVRTPFVKGGQLPDLTTIAVVPARVTALILAFVSANLQALGLTRLVATVLQPASELGAAGVEEMHQQTVGLLSFKPLKKEIYDAQVAFNLLARLGEGAKIDLNAEVSGIREHVQLIGGAVVAASIELQLIQAPIFHGFTSSIFVELDRVTAKEELSSALRGGRLAVVEEQSPSIETAAGKAEVVFSVRDHDRCDRSTFWIWMASDNLRLAAWNAVACALELVALRPPDGVN